ncbi:MULTISPECIES: hypothetical protein [Helicobacter]|uniref:Uncharacterized protein n=1 Tax=Helicobacter bilis ATCC 43879 TaxID=613026 RepID=C3XGM8_9HELI|nr:MULTISPECIES: hypothetical protein [Helicobacter]EEO24167.1 hypothetical protein HRAG_01224 [Helicobacter bilis ATCC 43879]
MFRDGNNQALQLVMQGYSDSIRAKTSNQGLAMANAFNQGLSNAVQTHDNHEQAMRNRALTDEQIQTAKHNNAYLADTHDTRVAQTHQQEMMNDLDIKFKSDTHDYRVGQEQQAERQMKLNNNYQAKLNEEQKLTSASRVNATNNQNYATSSQAKTSKKYSDMERANYEIENVYTDGKGNYYYNSKRTQAMDSATAEARMKRNAEKEQNRREYQNRFTSDNRQVVAGNQAQEAQNTFNMKMGDQQNKMYDEAKTSIQASGDTYDDIVYKLGEAARNNESQITLRNGTKMSVEMASMLGNGMLRGNGGGIGGVSINNKNDMTFREQVADAVKIFRDANATEEQKEKARATLATEKDIKELYKKVGGYALAAEQMQQIAGQDRLNTFIGFLGQYVGGDNAKQYGELSAAQSNILTSLGTSALKGTLSNMDMNIIRKQVSDLRKSGAFNEGVLVSALNKMIKDIEYSTENFGGVQILTPMAQAQYNSFVKLRQALIER